MNKYKPTSPEEAAKWWQQEKEKNNNVYWDGVDKVMLSSPEADLRKLEVKDLSKVIRVRSEADISGFLEGHWSPTPSVQGKLKYMGAVYKLADESQGKRIGYVYANIPGDAAYNDSVIVYYSKESDTVTVVTSTSSPSGGMDARQYGNSSRETGKWSLAKPTGKALILLLKRSAFRRADLVPKYGKPMKNFNWGSELDRGQTPIKGFSSVIVDKILKILRGKK